MIALFVLSALMLLIESLTSFLWRAAVWSCFFAALWLFEAPSILGGFAPEIAASAYFAGLIFWLWRDWPVRIFPTPQAILQRMERASALPHRPLSSLLDQAALKNDALWERRRIALRAALSGLRPALPLARLAQADPWALRMLAALLFITGLAWAGPRSLDRLRDGAFPWDTVQSSAGMDAAPLQIWVTPPVYTGLAAVTLGAGRNDPRHPLEVAAGSALKITMHRFLPVSFSPPLLCLDETCTTLQRAADRDYVGAQILEATTRLRIYDFGIKRADYALAPLPDTPPQLSQAQEPYILPDGRIRFFLKALDDYGATELRMDMTLPPGAQAPAMGAPAQEIRPLTTPPRAEATLNPAYDYAAHAWAGREVIFTFSLSDARGQASPHLSMALTLPERFFRNPASQKIVALRKALMAAPQIALLPVAEGLEEILSQPQAFKGDLRAVLGLRMAASRLVWARADAQTLESVIDLLWQVAVRLEDGGDLQMALRKLEGAQQALSRALPDSGALTDAQRMELMRGLQSALDNFLSALQQELARGEVQPSSPLAGLQKLASQIDARALTEFMAQLEDALRRGDTQSARQMLAQLQGLTDMLGAASMQSMPQDIRELGESLGHLQELIARQQDLKQTLEDSSDQQTPFMAPLITRQDALRDDLGDVMLRSGEVLGQMPDRLGKASLAMRGASQSMQKSQTPDALRQQQEAIDHMRSVHQGMMEGLAEKLSRLTGMRFSAQGLRLDPLGRPLPGQDGNQGLVPGMNVRIPEASEQNQVHEILKTLREKASEFDRPPEEREYLRRLLRHF